MSDATEPPEIRYFSLEEANRMLPLVRRIVEDLVERYREIQPILARLDGLAPGDRRAKPGARLRSKVEDATAQIDALVAELHDLGCQFKGFDEGLVDWYSHYADRTVFLCWKLGEPEIAWWHQVDAGFRGRQPILPSQRDAFRSTPRAGA